jgi:hypothetical protein
VLYSKPSKFKTSFWQTNHIVTVISLVEAAKLRGKTADKNFCQSVAFPFWHQKIILDGAGSGTDTGSSFPLAANDTMKSSIQKFEIGNTGTGMQFQMRHRQKGFPMAK